MWKRNGVDVTLHYRYHSMSDLGNNTAKDGMEYPQNS